MQDRPSGAEQDAQDAQDDSVRNLADLLGVASRGRPDAPALLHPGYPSPLDGAEQTTWGGLDLLVDRAVVAFDALGLAPGDRVVLMLANTLAFPVAYFGALRAGLVVVPLDVTAAPPEVQQQLDDSGARAVIVSASAAATVLQVSPLTAVETVLVTGLDSAPAGAQSFDALLTDPDAGTPGSPNLVSTGEPSGSARAAGEDLAVLAYTSGTSGRPKGAMLSHRALLADLDNVSRISPPVAGPDDVVLLVLPLTHIYGLNTGLGLVARVGATGLILERFDPSGTLAAVAEHAVTVVLGAPPVFVAWSLRGDVAKSFTSVRLAISGAAPMPEAAARRLLEATGRPIFEAYGLTETAPSVASTLMSEVPRGGSIGRPLPGVEVRLVDAAGVEVDEDDPGEICVRGANLFSGYWPDRREGPDADGWWPTGDVAVRDATGALTLVDRRRDLILVSGFNVYPREVEQALLTHPDVLEAAVLGIPHPYSGEAVRALVVPRPGASLSVDELLEHVGRLLARFKCPTSIEVVDELPHSVTGKVSKGRLRESLREPAAGRELLRDPQG